MIFGFNYHLEGDNVELVIKDGSGKRIETHRCNVRDKSRWRKILEYAKEKYGLEPYLKPDEQVAFKEDSEEEQKDIDWFGWTK